jgi:hypothetical protein
MGYGATDDDNLFHLIVFRLISGERVTWLNNNKTNQKPINRLQSDEHC